MGLLIIIGRRIIWININIIEQGVSMIKSPQIITRPMLSSIFFTFIILGVLMTAMAGCVKKRTSPPPELIHDSKVLGMTGVRTWAFEHSPLFEEDLTTSVKQAQRYSPTRHLDASGHFNILTLSGGGANGAFGAGILIGWSAAGTRPTFKMVTGISTGALIAPFAFLGADYDQILRQVYTSVETEDIVNLRFFKYFRRGVDSLADSSPLQGLLEKYVTEDVIRSVALAHQTGRRLYIGTTDLDANRLVIWNMGVIAASDRPEGFDLFRKILLASASIPVLFPVVCHALTTDSVIEVYGSETSGEVEYVLCIVSEDEVYVGLGSDHTDRHLEEVDIPRAKQICPNLMGHTVWPLEEVESHWDDLLMSANVVKDGADSLYQEGRLGLLLNPAELMSFVKSKIPGPLENLIIFSGTMGMLTGEFIFGQKFSAKRIDERLNRRLEISYDIRPLDYLTVE